MKLHYILCFAVLSLYCLGATANNIENNSDYIPGYAIFKVPISENCDMAFRLAEEGDDFVSVACQKLYDITFPSLDTLFIPKTIDVEGKTYKVTGLDESVFTNQHGMKCIYIPNTIVELHAKTVNDDVYSIFGTMPELQSFVVEEGSPLFKTVDNGVLLSKDGKQLIFYPPRKQGTEYFIPEGVETLSTLAFGGDIHNDYELRYLEASSTLKELKTVSIIAYNNLEKIYLKDSLEVTDQILIIYGLANLKTLVLNRLSRNPQTNFIAHCPNVENIYILDENIDFSTNNSYLGFNDISENCRLFVPRHCVEAYRADEDWCSTFKYILPIEPPVVAGLDHAEISWVNNFSATGYEWLLYTDAEQTQLYVTLYFDNKGNLLKMEYPQPSPNYAAAFSSPLLAAPAEQETREPAKEYYTYTLPEDLLEPGVQYYYECRAMKEEEIISTVEGAFAPPEVETSLSSLQTGLQIGPNPAQTFVNLRLDNGSATIADDVFILSSTGSIVAHYTDYDMLMPLDIASLPAGQYLVIIRVAGGQYSNQLIKQ